MRARVRMIFKYWNCIPQATWRIRNRAYGFLALSCLFALFICAVHDVLCEFYTDTEFAYTQRIKKSGETNFANIGEKDLRKKLTVKRLRLYLVHAFYSKFVLHVSVILLMDRRMCSIYANDTHET